MVMMIMTMIKKMAMITSMLLRVKTMPHLELLQAGVHLGKELRVATKKIDLKVHEKKHFARGSHQQLNIMESTSSSLMTHC